MNCHTSIVFVATVVLLCLCSITSAQDRNPPADTPFEPLPADPLPAQPVCAKRECKKKGCCPSLWTAWGDSCYRYFDQPLDQWSAERYCRQFSTGSRCDSDCTTEENQLGHLVSILSEEEQDFVYTYWRTNQYIPNGAFAVGDYEAYPGIWIGFNDRLTEGTYTWTDHENVDITCWSSGQPDNNYFGEEEDCVLAWWWQTPELDGFWNDVPCRLRYPFMCKLPRY